MDEFNWSRVPTYEGGWRSTRLATSEGGTKHEPLEEDVNMYDCLSKDDEEDEEMEPAPAGTNKDPIKEVMRKLRNDERQERNENRKTAREERRKRRQAMKERRAKLWIKDVD